MTNLTTDLIKDVFALLPEHIDEIHAKQDDFELVSQPYAPLYFHAKHDLASWSGLIEEDRFNILQHCLKLIPAFQEPTKQANVFIQKINWLDKKYAKEKLTGILLHKKQVETLLEELPYKSIASATLHGQGEFPPSTVEDLCKSYKYVMS